MTAPFVIFALPRSRTAWLSQWLSYQGRIVGHDTGIEASSCQDFIDRVCRKAGTVETGAMFAHSLLRKAWPASQFVTVRRPRDDVAASLARFGVNDIEAELIERDRHLDAMEAAGAARVEYASLSDVNCCAALFEGLLGVPFDFRHWQAMAATNIQIDVPARLARLVERHDAIEALKREAERLIAVDDAQFVSIAWEPLAPVSDEAAAMGAGHSVEVNGGALRGHPYKPNIPLMLQHEQAGSLRFMGARLNGRLVGYMIWTFVPDVESEGVMYADQGPWFVADEPAIRKLQIGRKMLNRALDDLSKAGIQSAQLHHQVHGRGAKLGALFVSMGAVEHQHRYMLWIGDRHA